MRYLDNPILNTDSYKASHWLQYPPGADGMHSYIESRGGEYARIVFFGLQMLIKEYLCRPVTGDMVAQAKDFFAAHGEPFNECGWRKVIERHGGLLPLEIRAVPEGLLLPTHLPLITVESTDAELYWLVSYIETLLVRVWYPISVATQSWYIKQIIRAFLEATSDDPSGQLPFKLHDFGARGVSSAESAAIGALAHLVNFRGTDTISGVLAGQRYYHEPMAGFSIPAAEHSTITSWGREGEIKAYRNMLRQFGKPGALFACVSDSYDIYSAVENLWGRELREEVVRSGAAVVVRPDSGSPPEVVLKTAILLDRAFGSKANAKGYRVLNNVRIIQGDGINIRSIREILSNLKINGYSADNIAFGMGGALLQQVHRDTQKFAMKCSAIRIGGVWQDAFKDPVTDPGKASKRGRMSLLRNRKHKDFTIARRDDHAAHDDEWEELLAPVWRNGELLRDETLATVRSRAEEASLPGASSWAFN